MRALLTTPLLISLLHCGGDETLSGYGASGTVWTLTELNNEPVTALTTITFPEEGKITGEAPCNAFFGTQSEPYPWFKADNIASTRRACPDLDAETRFLQALSLMTLAELSPTTLILSNEVGGEMVFKASP